MKTCRLCRQERCTELLNCGDQPVCHRFLRDIDQDEKYPLLLGQCEACGLVQLIEPMPLEKVTRRYDWIKYKEPEAHLQSMAQIIASLPGISYESRIIGVCEHEVLLLEHLRAIGFLSTEIIDPVRDLGLDRSDAGAEVIQGCLDCSSVGAIVRDKGTYDVVIARRIFEHSYDAVEFLKALRLLVRPEGYLVIEVPDCKQAFEHLDVGTIWEEHISYFTPETFRKCFAFNGFDLKRLEIFPYPHENCLVAFAQKSDSTPAIIEDALLKLEKDRAGAFAIRLLQLRNNLQYYLEDYRKRYGKIALLGAGHRSCVYINILGLKDVIEFVVDDDPNKKDLRMPGSHLQIFSSDALLENDIKLCLLGINPESEERVIQNNPDFIEGGGVFSSVSPYSKRALLI